MKSYDKDTTAGAVVLGDYGKVSFLYNAEKGWYLSFTRHKRIKIINKNGYDHANINIEYYDPGIGDAEKFISLRGVTYNDDEGKMVKSKLTKDGIFNERVNKYWKQRKFTMPDIKEGSIIEYEYTMESVYSRYLRDWEFQSTIPVVWSEYRLRIPDMFTYKTLMQGYHPLTVNDRGRVDEEIEYSGGVTSGGFVRGGKELVQLNTMRFVSTDVPAFIDEPFMTSRRNFISKIKFELATVRFKGQLARNMVKSWDDMNKSFLQSPYFGDLVRGSGFLQKITDGLVAGINDDLEKVTVIYDHVKNTMQWDGFNSKYANFSLKKAYEEKKGGSADVNLILVTMLKKAGLAADPVLLSTRNHGFIQTAFPNSRQFNYVICKVDVGDRTMLLDATDPYLPMTLIPKRCLNGKGFVVSETNSGWVELTATKKRLIKVSAVLELNPEGNMVGDIKRVYDGYDALSRRKRFYNEGESEYISSRSSALDWEVDEFEVSNADDPGKSLIEKIAVNIPTDTDEAQDVIYLDPMILLKKTENPFKSSFRKYPVNYGSKSEQTFLLSLTVPDGYIVEEMPEKTAFVVADGGAKFSYGVTVNGNKITVLSRFFINSTIISQMDYAALKEFYGLVVSKHAEQIVLKRT